LFDDDDDYAAFERVLTETLEIQPMRVCDYSVMPKYEDALKTLEQLRTEDEETRSSKPAKQIQ